MNIVLDLLISVLKVLLFIITLQFLLFFCLFTLHRLEKFKDSSKGYPIIRDFIAGATSGTFACVISNPMDVVKTRRQMSLSPEGKVKYFHWFPVVYEKLFMYH